MTDENKQLTGRSLDWCMIACRYL